MQYAEMIGTVIEAADTAECFLIGITYDSDANHQFIDHVLVGVASKVNEARYKGIPFFSKLRFADVQLDCFPYRVPMIPRAARGAVLEPFYGGRDTAHSTKSGTRATCTTSTVLHLGDLPVFHTGMGWGRECPSDHTSATASRATSRARNGSVRAISFSMESCG